MKTTMAIPCIDRHIKNLDNLLTHVVNGTELPDEVVIAVFPILKKEQHENINKLIDKFGKYFELNVIKSIEQLPREKARNFLIPNLHNDLILWHDADDTQHPQRVEIVKRFFKEHDIVHLCHSYRFSKEKKVGKIVYDKIRCYKTEKIVQQYNKFFLNYNNIDWTTFAFGGGIVRTHAGVCCLRRDVLKKIKFTINYPGEDSKFCFDVLREFRKTILIDAKIYNYN